MSRHHLLGAPAVALALAGLLLAAPARAAEAEKLLPNDTEVVFTIHVKQVLTSDLAKKLPLDKLKDLVKGNGDANKILTDLGFDPFTDLDSITTAFSSGSEPDKGLAIVHGRFDVAKFKAKAEEVAKDMEGVLKIHKVPDGLGGQTELYEVNAPGSPQASYVALIGKDTLVASAGKDYVQDAIEKAAGKKKSALENKELQALLGRIDAKQSLWVAVLGSTLAKSPFANADEAKQVIDKLKDATAGITIDKDVKLQVSVSAKSADDAKALGEKMKEHLDQATGVALLFGGKNKGLSPLIDLLKSVKPSVKGKVVGLQVEITGDMIEEAIKQGRE
jgi:hypothetical protein